MKKLILKKISFGSYMKLTATCAAALSVLIGVIAFANVLFGDSVTYQGYLVSYPKSILYAGGIALLFPLGWVLFFCSFAVLMFLPFRLVMHLFKGIYIKAAIETIDEKSIDCSEECSGLIKRPKED